MSEGMELLRIQTREHAKEVRKAARVAADRAGPLLGSSASDSVARLLSRAMIDAFIANEYADLIEVAVDDASFADSPTTLATIRRAVTWAGDSYGGYGYDGVQFGIPWCSPSDFYMRRVWNEAEHLADELGIDGAAFIRVRHVYDEKVQADLEIAVKALASALEAPPEPDQVEWLTAEQVTHEFNVSANTLATRSRRNRWDVRKNGTLRLYRRSDVEAAGWSRKAVRGARAKKKTK